MSHIIKMWIMNNTSAMFGQAFRSFSQARAEHWGMVLLWLYWKKEKEKNRKKNGPAPTDSPSANHLMHADFHTAMETGRNRKLRLCHSVIWALPSCRCEAQISVFSTDKEKCLKARVCEVCTVTLQKSLTACGKSSATGIRITATVPP